MNGLRLRVRTRSKVQDYRFVGEQPETRWWEAGYGRWTDFSRPTVIVESNRLFIAGIGSGRTDSKGAGIHYALLGEFTTPVGAQAAARLVASVCAQLSSKTRLAELGERLDQLDEDTWAAAINGEQKAVEGVASVLASLPVASGEADPLRPRYQAWICEAGTPGFMELARTAALVAEKKAGVAVYLNLASAEELHSFGHKGEAVGVVCREGPDRPKPFAPLSGGRSSRSQLSR